MTDTIVEATLTGPIIIEDPATVSPRPYNAAEDARKFTFEEAVKVAERRSAEHGGVRQRIFTLPVPDADAHIRPRYLIQSI